MGKALKRRLLVLLLAATTGFAAPLANGALPADPPPLVVGYVFPQNGELDASRIDARAMDRVNYAFAVLRHGRIALGTPDDAGQLRQLTALRRENPSLAVLVSVGGWLGSGQFSDMAATAESRAVFLESVMQFLKAYDLDGVDVDWEYPGLPGAGNRFRVEDKQNFTLLLGGLRERFDQEKRATGRRLWLTIAAGASDDYVSHTELSRVQDLVDSVNLMSYDFYEAGSDPITGNHAPLYTDPEDPKKDSTDLEVRAFGSAGVSPQKIVLGVPFYARLWGRVPNRHHGLFQPGKPIPNSYQPYSAIAGTMRAGGYTRYWDAASQVPYLYNADKEIFVSYEDPESLALKCKYVLSHHLGGVMFWSYMNDPGGQLLGVMDRSLRVSRP